MIITRGKLAASLVALLYLILVLFIGEDDIFHEMFSLVFAVVCIWIPETLDILNQWRINDKYIYIPDAFSTGFGCFILLCLYGDLIWGSK